MTSNFEEKDWPIEARERLLHAIFPNDPARVKRAVKREVDGEFAKIINEMGEETSGESDS